LYDAANKNELVYSLYLLINNIEIPLPSNIHFDATKLQISGNISTEATEKIISFRLKVNTPY
jgi:hypothetical protein